MNDATPRERLLEAATELFAAGGYDAVNVEKLRKRAGVSNGSFFHLFAAKEDLAADLLVTCVADYQAAIIRALARCESAEDGIAAIIRGHVRWVTNNPDKARFMLDDARAAWFAKATDRLNTHNKAFGAAIERWRAPLVAQGHLRDVPIGIFVATVAGPVNMICRAWVSGRQITSAAPQRSENDLIALACHALVALPRPKTKATRTTARR
jgi:AcrR family transcriptional regulator